MSRTSILDLLGFLLGLAMLGLGVTALNAPDAGTGDYLRLAAAVVVTVLFALRLRRALTNGR